MASQVSSTLRRCIRGFSLCSWSILVEILNTELGGESTPKHEHRTEDPAGLVGILGGVATACSGGDSLWSVDIATRRHRRKHPPLGGGCFRSYFFELSSEEIGPEPTQVELPLAFEHIVGDREKEGVARTDETHLNLFA